MVTGRRVDPDLAGMIHLDPGDYGKDVAGRWWARVPDDQYDMASLDAYEVTEHDDGTISVSPSIMAHHGFAHWHGYLEHGVWREI